MADPTITTINDGTQLEAPALDDIFPSTDVSDTTEASTGTSKPISYKNIVAPRTLYTWIEDFDDEVAAVEFESGLVADFWVTAGTNYAAANVTYTADAGGTLEAKCAAANDDSVTIFGVGNIRVDLNPIMEARFKIDDIATAFCCVGFAEGSFADKAAPDDDIFVVGLDEVVNIVTSFVYP